MSHEVPVVGVSSPPGRSRQGCASRPGADHTPPFIPTPATISPARHSPSSSRGAISRETARPTNNGMARGGPDSMRSDNTRPSRISTPKRRFLIGSTSPLHGLRGRRPYGATICPIPTAAARQVSSHRHLRARPSSSLRVFMWPGPALREDLRMEMLRSSSPFGLRSHQDASLGSAPPPTCPDGASPVSRFPRRGGPSARQSARQQHSIHAMNDDLAPPGRPSPFPKEPQSPWPWISMHLAVPREAAKRSRPSSTNSPPP